jgi:RsiW-degrading membrane proteinase PrsW (M82 family)
MQPGRDPVERGTDGDEDLQEVATWEPRSVLDWVAVRVHAGLRPLLGATLVVFATVLLAGLLSSGLAVAITDPQLRILVSLSVVPALLLVVYVWLTDVTTEPPDLLVATFFLGILVAPVAGVVNSSVEGALSGVVDVETGVASVAFYFLVVGVGEETAKLLAVRLYAYPDERFDAVIDGAVYGAMAGLGFALLENALYITSNLGGPGGPSELVAVATQRALAGPGHVIYSGIAGYYLGLAKFNRENAGPLVVKGILLAATFHGAYNTLVGLVPLWIATGVGVSLSAGLVAFIVSYDGVVGFVLYRKLSGYRRAYERAYRRRAEPRAELTEFDPGVDGRAGANTGGVESTPDGGVEATADPDGDHDRSPDADRGAGDNSDPDAYHGSGDGVGPDGDHGAEPGPDPGADG